MRRPSIFVLALLLVAAPAVSGEPTIAGRLELGKIQLKDYEFRRAEKIYRSILDEDPTNVKALTGLSRALSGVGEHPSAKAIYYRIAKIDPKSPVPYLGLGSLALYVNRKKEARAHYERAVRIAPRNAPSHAGLARVEIESGDFEAADRLLDRAEELVPKHQSVLSARSEYCFRTGDMEGSARTLRKLLEINPKSLEANQRLANGFLEPSRPFYRPPEVSRRYARAVEDATRRYRVLDLDGAEAAFRELDGESAEDGRPAFFLGLIEFRRGRNRLAIDHLWRAVGREPENFLFRNALTAAYRMKIDSQRAEYGGGEDGTDRLRPLATHLPIGEVEGISRIVRGYDRLLPSERRVIRWAVAPLEKYVPNLISQGITHDILGFEEAMCTAKERQWFGAKRTHDGRWYGALRGVGGDHAATAIEAVMFAAAFGYDTFAHEFAHQVHRYGFSVRLNHRIKRLYARAKRKDLCLDYYAASNDREYFAQGYEAFISVVKSPFRHSLRRHTRAELRDRDPDLYALLLEITGTEDPDPRLAKAAPGILEFYGWAGDEIEKKRAEALYRPLLGAEPSRK